MTDALVPFCIDECVNPKVAVGLRDAGHHAVHVSEVGRRGETDFSQLKYATAEGLSIVTYNIAHFAELHKQWARSGWEHAGIFLAEDFRYQRAPFALINDLRLTARHCAERMGGGTEWRYNQMINVLRGTP